MLRAGLFASLILLTACGGARREQIEEDAREAMLPVVTRIIAKEMPEVTTITPLARCVTENVTDEEAFQLVEAALQGVSGRDTQMVLAIIRRPEVRSCAFEADVRGLI